MAVLFLLPFAGEGKDEGEPESTNVSIARADALRVGVDNYYSRSGNSCLGNNSLIDRAWPAVRPISPFLSRDSTI